MSWSDLARFGRAHPTPGETTDEEKAQIERLHVRHDELVNMDEDEWTGELANEAEAIETRLTEIEAAVEARAVFRPEDLRLAGCIITVSDEGRMQLVQGLVRPEDIPAAQANDDAQDGTGHDDAGAAGDSTSNTQALAISGRLKTAEGFVDCGHGKAGVGEGHAVRVAGCGYEVVRDGAADGRGRTSPGGRPASRLEGQHDCRSGDPRSRCEPARRSGRRCLLVSGTSGAGLVGIAETLVTGADACDGKPAD